MVDLAAECGSYPHTISAMQLCQSVVMAWLPGSPATPEIAQLPISKANVGKLIQRGVPSSLMGLMKDMRSDGPKQKQLWSLVSSAVGKENGEKIMSALEALPIPSLSCQLGGDVKIIAPNSDMKLSVTVAFDFVKGKRKCKWCCL
jgi:hypothetical protein